MVASVRPSSSRSLAVASLISPLLVTPARRRMCVSRSLTLSGKAGLSRPGLSGRRLFISSLNMSTSADDDAIFGPTDRYKLST